MKLLILCLVFFSCSTKVPNELDKNSLINSHLEMRFPNEHMFGIADMDEALSDVYVKKHPNTHPGKHCSSFREYGVIDCFVLLADLESNVKRLVVLQNIHSNKPGIVEIPIYLSKTYKNNNLFLLAAKKRLIDNLEAEKSNSSILMTGDGVELRYFEKSSWIIFWNGSIYQKTLVAD